ncbi:MAG: FAD-dependent oxidoreductase [Candidatus Omnitrophota bacterium]
MKNYLIIGNSAAGIAAAEAIRTQDKTNKITIISDENYPAYCRCLLSYYLAGDLSEDKLKLREDNFYEQNKITLLPGKKAEKVDIKKNKVLLDDKTQIAYDLLLIAAGGSPTIPEIKGIKKSGVFGFRKISDIKAIGESLPIATHCIVLGGGLIGLKAAAGLKKRKKEVKVIVRSNRVLSQMLDFSAAQFLRKRLEQNGIEVITETDLAEVIGNGNIRAIKLDRGKALAAEMLVVAKGVSPNIKFIQDSGIKTNVGIIANKFLQTNIENIFAAGDICETEDLARQVMRVNALWPNAVEQGKIAGGNMAAKIIGKDLVEYDGSISMNSIEIFGLPVISMGVISGKKEDGFEEFSHVESQNEVYKKIVIKDNLIKGMIYLGRIENSGLLLKLIKSKLDISPIRDELLKDTFNFAAIIEYLKEEELSLSDKLFRKSM